MNYIQQYINHFKINVDHIDTVPESFSSDVYSLTLVNGEKVILKIPYSKSKLLREYEILTLLEGKLPVPKVLLMWEGDETSKGAFLLSHLNGYPIEGKVDRDLAYQLGELLAKLHQVQMDQYNLVDGINDWWQGIKLIFDDWLEEGKNVLTTDVINKCEHIFHNFYVDLPTPDGPCVVHMDFRPGNILVSNNKVVGLIDYESTRGGSADADFTKIKLYIWDKYDGTKEAFIEGYKSIRPLPNIERTLPFYSFYNAVGGIAWCVRRGQLEDKFFKESMETLQLYLK